MPKDRSSSSPATRDVRHHPYKLHSRGSDVIKAEKSAERKEWEDAVCPICLENPHNAVLLLCTSHDKGCRPFMCNTSYRHSNCLDQYRKAQASLKKLEVPRQESEQHSHEAASSGEPLDLSIVDTNSFPGARRASRRPGNIHNHPLDPAAMSGTSDDVLSLHITSMESVFATRRSRRHNPISSMQSAGIRLSHQGIDSEDVSPSTQEPNVNEHVTNASPSKRADVKDLLCPLCRGKVNSWLVIDGARKFLNGKSRSCSQETCTFSGNYEELRAHARCEHPTARPSEVDPARQRDWRRMERQRDMGDVLSSIRSAMPGAAVFGDYVIEDQGEMESEAIDLLGDEGNWWRVLFLFQIFGPAASAARDRSISSRLRGHQQRQRRTGTARLRQWGESFHRGSNEANNNMPGSNSADEQAAEIPPRRSRNPRRHWGDMS
ncbi:hypothetical protein GOP47_0014109 [Adiantum capillus-veneris]|uniref:Uncharacterized protein n=1 Tax=Adiantum capillus-veneris TaxID=13818 RepID=A0A9D4ZDV1_ADICA|nr:hypothetical protein GOP47_0014109 [Adiantum capillus-veneris]